MNRVFLLINLSAFITVLVSLYFGMSISNAVNNQYTTHLDSFEGYFSNPIDDIPVLTGKAVVISFIFILLSFGLELYALLKSKLSLQKKILLGLLPIYIILFSYSGLVLANTSTHSFLDYGMIWVLLNICLIFGNSILLIVKR